MLQGPYLFILIDNKPRKWVMLRRAFYREGDVMVEESNILSAISEHVVLLVHCSVYH